MKIDKSKIEFFFFKLFERIVRAVGFKRIKYVAKPLAFVFYYLIPLRKNVVVENLKRAFPEKDEKEIEKLAFKNYVNVALTFLELLYASKITKEELEKIVHIDKRDKEKILETARRNSGAIFLTGHYGNWEIAGLFVGALVNEIKPLHVLVKNQSNKYITDWLLRVRSKFGSKIVTVGKSSKELLRIAASNQIVALLADQRGKEDGLRIKFFGIETPVHTGLAVIALKTKTPVIFMVATRREDGTYELTAEEISCAQEKTEWNENVRCIMQAYMSKIEEKLRAHPEQWFWMHKIWKYSPRKNAEQKHGAQRTTNS